MLLVANGDGSRALFVLRCGARMAYVRLIGCVCTGTRCGLYACANRTNLSNHRCVNDSGGAV